ncbi:MAG: methyltransferase domain-containing protein [Deltaproteobacteria bacterium]|nr:methyltransferase domain-containing protein [Deltaproteobacteria bacterium]
MQAFWERQVRRLGRFRGAPSTGYYLEGEKRLIDRCLPEPAGARVLKLDLWNEVKNTNVLGWLADRGAITCAVDISGELARQAAEQFRAAGRVPRFGVANLYHLPFADGSFDFLYTMGTIEHAPEMDRCVAEIHRVLKPGGTAVVGVPNRLDPFARPALVALMNLLGIYPYGFEQSLSRKELAGLCESGGLEVFDTDGVLFMPGALRMAELWLMVRSAKAGRAVGSLHWPFRALADALPALNKHGYLIAALVRKPQR